MIEQPDRLVGKVRQLGVLRRQRRAAVAKHVDGDQIKAIFHQRDLCLPDLCIHTDAVNEKNRHARAGTDEARAVGRLVPDPCRGGDVSHADPRFP
jgi:hypothetical protein